MGDRLMIRFQPAPVTDHITHDGTELTKLPYPIVADQFGVIPDGHGDQRIIGFVADPSKQRVDLWWNDIRDLQHTVGMYVITATGGRWYTNVTAIQSVQEVDIDE